MDPSLGNAHSFSEEADVISNVALSVEDVEKMIETRLEMIDFLSQILHAFRHLGIIDEHDIGRCVDLFRWLIRVWGVEIRLSGHIDSINQRRFRGDTIVSRPSIKQKVHSSLHQRRRYACPAPSAG